VNWFNRKQKSVLCIDISSVAVKLLEISKTNNSYKIEKFITVPFLPKGPADTNTPEITEALRTALTESKTSLKHATIAVPPSSVITKIITMPAFLTEAQMEEQIMIDADQHVPYAIDDLFFDFEVQGVNNKNPDIVDLLFVASRRTDVDERVDALASIGLKTDIVDVETFAMENAMSLLPNYSEQPITEQTVALVNIGASFSSLTVLHNGRIEYTREQEFGGKQLTEKIQYQYGLSFNEAEQKKIEGGLPSSYTEDIFEPFKFAMAQQIQRSIQLYNSSAGNRVINYLVLCGGCASINDIDKFIEGTIKTPVYIANPLINMSLSNKIEINTLYKQAPSLMVACGLAIRSFD
jgi:type IV pilus assembly protein PilM